MYCFSYSRLILIQCLDLFKAPNKYILVVVGERNTTPTKPLATEEMKGDGERVSWLGMF